MTITEASLHNVLEDYLGCAGLMLLAAYGRGVRSFSNNTDFKTPQLHTAWMETDAQ
jgi:hypothetical protein